MTTVTTPTYTYDHLVTLEETNLVGNVYFTNYLRWQGHCRERFLGERAPGVLRALRGELALVTVDCHCAFFSELYAMDRVAIRMSLTASGEHQVGMGFAYYRTNSAVPELVARGGQTVACMRRTEQGMRPVPVPDELRAALAPYRSGT
ncbi:acyl-CoA thioesterase [Streptomyces ficellus]|uniref:Acyl-CoA thioesterase n=1 Tax=Streptomyces ficellus TaxID=1977088 RepID=A0ABT7Z8Y3_9ACTN|nr:acyl-CoA thioesterase [Streptomyces ficellus]MDN3295971.1 acyl-CoA thioesterase [Streptomyces ficellus]